MLKGLIIYNGVDAERNKWFINEIIKEGACAGLDIELALTDKLFSNKENKIAESYENITNNCDFAIMRDRDYVKTSILEEIGIKVFNPSKISKLCNDKWETYSFFKNKVPMMYTQKTKLPYPFIMKSRSGHGGSEVFLVRNDKEYENALSAADSQGVHDDNLIYQMIASDTGKDLRVYVIGEFVMASMLRESETDFRANVSLGGSASYKELSDAEMNIVAKVSEELPPGFYGIDIIYNKETPLLNEIEDVVGSRMLYQYTDINVAREYIIWLKKQLIKE